MFDRIAHRYDLVNTVLSLGTDGGWRRRAARETAMQAGGSALDVACGSGATSAYRYLSDTVDSYRTPTELLEMARAAGWSRVVFTPVAASTVGILRGQAA